MRIALKGGGTVTVLDNGTVEFRRNGRTFRTDGRGTYAQTVEWVESLAYGRDIRYVTR